MNIPAVLAEKLDGRTLPEKLNILAEFVVESMAKLPQSLNPENIKLIRDHHADLNAIQDVLWSLSDEFKPLGRVIQIYYHGLTLYEPDNPLTSAMVLTRTLNAYAALPESPQVIDLIAKDLVKLRTTDLELCRAFLDLAAKVK